MLRLPEMRDAHPATRADDVGVDVDPELGSSADQLAHALARNRRELATVKGDEARARRAEVIEHFTQYVELLREASAATLARYSFKLEFPDGRWNLAEKELTVTPHVGECVEFADGERWRIRGSQFVHPRPSGKPPREFFVCAPAA